ncbi:hypothetical protein GN156_07445 [bacterium LRH843]|nr:hypothetical protein [bacterium LRH843]
MYQSKTYFHAALKIIGLLTIIWSLTQIAPVISQFYSVYNQPDIMPVNDLSHYRFSLIFQVVYPILLFVIGIYLLKSGDAIVQLAFRDLNEKNEDQISLLFFLFMKLAGLVLIIYSLPKTFQIISNVIFFSSAQIVDISDQMQFIVPHLVTTFINLLLGIYLLRSGNIFYKIGFTKEEDTNDLTE